MAAEAFEGTITDLLHAQEAVAGPRQGRPAQPSRPTTVAVTSRQTSAP